MTSSTSQGWLLTVFSLALCVAGCSVIFADDAYRKLFPKFITKRYPFSLEHNVPFLNASLAFSAGCLLFTALSRLLPEALEYFGKADAANPQQQLIVSYAAGIFISLVLNYILHLITSESVVHCAHDHDDKDLEAASDEEIVNHHHHHHEHHEPAHDTHSHHHSHTDHAEATETTPLVREVTTRKSLLHLITPGDAVIGECKGYSSAELCLYTEDDLHYCEIPAVAKDLLEITPSAHSLQLLHRSEHLIHESVDHANHHDHHHHVSTPISRLLLIGIQTILAITLHKFPEGFITFTTSETNPDLGLSIFLSLLFHNFTEGLMMCLPIYYSLSKSRLAKLKAFAICSLLGGAAHPLGAVAGYYFLHHAGRTELDRLNYIFGHTMAITSGFLLVIGVSMYSAAVSFNAGTSNRVMNWFLLGLVAIGVSSIFVD